MFIYKEKDSSESLPGERTRKDKAGNDHTLEKIVKTSNLY